MNDLTWKSVHCKNMCCSVIRKCVHFKSIDAIVATRLQTIDSAIHIKLMQITRLVPSSHCSCHHRAPMNPISLWADCDWESLGPCATARELLLPSPSPASSFRLVPRRMERAPLASGQSCRRGRSSRRRGRSAAESPTTRHFALSYLHMTTHGCSHRRRHGKQTLPNADWSGITVAAVLCFMIREFRSKLQ